MKAPTWYTREEILSALRLMNYSDVIAHELADWFVRHLQHAFDKGHTIGVRDAENRRPTPEPQGEAVPPGVYFNAQHDNFYRDSGEGMGSDFHRMWIARCCQFPDRPQPGEGGGEVEIRAVIADIISHCNPPNPESDDEVSASYALSWANRLTAALAKGGQGGGE